MDDFDLDGDVRDIASRVKFLSRSVVVHPQHKEQLRLALFEHHRALAGRSSAPSVRSRPSLFKRLSLVGLPAAAAALAASMVLWFAPISGTQSSPAVEAQRITTALARTAPTVTAWQWTLYHRSGGQQRVDRLGVRLTRFQRLYVDHGRAYLYSYGQWKLLAPIRPAALETPAALYWQRALSSLLANLRARDFVVLDSARVNGSSARGIRSVMLRGSDAQIAVTAWVDEKSGLILRLDRVVTRGNRVLERDVADYSYQRGG